MAEPLKNSFGTDVVERIGADVQAVYPTFDLRSFLDLALDGFEALELTPRAKQIANALAETLPDDRTKALAILQDSFGPALATDQSWGASDPDPASDSEDKTAGAMDGFRYLPHGYFVAEHGLDDLATSLAFQEELTKRFTAEFSIRAFFEHYQQETVAQARLWAIDENEHVRRLASEGCRPRLPWAGNLKAFIENPSEVLTILELLRNDSSEYVRRSVANNLNDISKDHPDIVIAVTKRWNNETLGTEDATNRTRMVRHALRTLIKKGNLGALDVLGFGPESPVVIGAVVVEPTTVAIGDKIQIRVELHHPSNSSSDKPAGALADLIVHFVKADGTTSPKVFKGRELHLQPGETSLVKKTISLNQQTTRTHYPGAHSIEVQLNGVRSAGPTFDLTT